MTALAAAVAPSMYVLVVRAMRIGTPMTRFIVGTLTTPPPIPSSPDSAPATSEIAVPGATRRARYVISWPVVGST